MNKKRIFSLLIMICIVVLSYLMIHTDYRLAKSNKPPRFAIQTIFYKDGGTTVYQGLGYKVIDYNQVDGRKDVVFIPFYEKENE